MAYLTQRQAAQQWSIPWSTFRRVVKSGKVSLDVEKRVDVSEMIRAFGEPPAQPETGTTEPVGATVAHPTKLENARLKELVAALEEPVRRADAERDRALDTVQRLLTHEAAPQPRWWNFGR